MRTHDKEDVMKSKKMAFFDGFSAVANPNIDLSVKLPREMEVDLTKSVSQKSIESIREVVVKARLKIEKDII